MPRPPDPEVEAKRDKAAAFVQANPSLTAKQASKQLGYTDAFIRTACFKRGVLLHRGTSGTGVRPEIEARRDKIEALFRAEPDLTVRMMVERLGYTEPFIRVACEKRGLQPKAAKHGPNKMGQVKQYFAANPDSTASQCAAALGFQRTYVSIICSKYKLGSRVHSNTQASDLAFELKASLMDMSYLKQAIEQDEPKKKLLRRIDELIELFTEATDRLATPPAKEKGEIDAVSQV